MTAFCVVMCFILVFSLFAFSLSITHASMKLAVAGSIGLVCSALGLMGAALYVAGGG